MVIKEKQGVAYCWRFILHIIFMKLYDKTNVIDIMDPNLLTLR